MQTPDFGRLAETYDDLRPPDRALFDALVEAADLTFGRVLDVGCGTGSFIADLTANIDVAVFTLANPYRVVVDLPELRFGLPDDAGSEGRGLISAYRYGQISKGKSRIVLDVTGPVAVDKSFVVPPAEFLRGLADLCAKHGIVVIADEVQTGTGRTGTFLASEQFGFKPRRHTSNRSSAACSVKKIPSV